MGKFSDENPQGTDITGNPVRLLGRVKRVKATRTFSFRRPIATSVSRMRGATTGRRGAAHVVLQPIEEALPRDPDAQPLDAAAQPAREGLSRLSEAVRVAWIAARDGRQHQRRVLDRTAEGTDRVERPGQGRDAVERDSPTRRLEPHDAAERGRDPDRAPGVGSERSKAESRRDGGAAPAARSARNALEVPRVVHRAE